MRMMPLDSSGSDNLAARLSLEQRLLFACARLKTSSQLEEEIRRILGEQVDWTAFAKVAVMHGLAGLAGHTLARVAPNLVPSDILAAFSQLISDTRQKNTALFAELALIVETLAKFQVPCVPFKGPVLALQCYGDLGLRAYRDLDILVKDETLGSVVLVLHELGYERNKDYTETQHQLIHRLQGQEIIFKKSTGTALEPHTRFTSAKLALDIDYEGIWNRTQEVCLLGHRMRTLAPEDEFLILAIHGGKELWWNIKWTSDLVAFLDAHPNLNWQVIFERARAQGCERMVLLAVELVRRFFAVSVLCAGENIRATSDIEYLVNRVAMSWQKDESIGPVSNKALSLDRLRLHDGISRRIRYMAKTILLPSPEHVKMISLPDAMSFAYVPIKFAHDALALPMWRGYKGVRTQINNMQWALAGSDLPLFLLPAGRATKGRIKRFRKRRANAKRLLANNPNELSAWIVLGDAESGLRRYRNAIESYDAALALAVNDRDTWRKRAAACEALGISDSVVEDVPGPQDAKTWALRAGFYHSEKKYAEATDAANRALALDPSIEGAKKIAIHSRLQSCDWSTRDEDLRSVSAALEHDDCLLVSCDFMSVSHSEADNRTAANFVSRSNPPSRSPLWRGERYSHEKLRIAYVSADLHAHATGFLMAGVFESHDQRTFETTAVSLGASDSSPTRTRIESSFHKFIDAQSMSNFEVAHLLRELEIDVAIDLKGYTAFRRTGIFAHRPAPVQVNYLGFPGTMDASYIDYIIADRVVVPSENQIHYSEKIAYLPHSYQPNDSRRELPLVAPSRGELGLPEAGFVFTCLNNSYKITPEIFEVWLRLLRQVDNSVLWLLEDSRSASLNLRRAAQNGGVDLARIIFAPRTTPSKHLSRQMAADLFVDTLPYNAHTTASDALWVGLPVLTCMGTTFPARVAASLLHALGMPELVASSLAEYESLALALARDSARLASLKAKILKNRFSEPLFDTGRYTRNLETALKTMNERQRAGLPPAAFAVTE